MNQWLRRLLWTLGILVVFGGPAYYALALHSPVVEGEYPIDMARLRHFANSIPGDKPSEIRYEHVMDFEFAEAMVMAGEPWKGTLLPIYSWQLRTPAGTLVIDSAMNRELAKPESMVPFYDQTAYERMLKGMDQARQIVITHEHMDHIGGLAAHPRLPALLPALRLTEEQVGNPQGMDPAELPAAVMQNYSPLRYDDLQALAPGVVLVKAPGHTPGSQMVYVQRADGRELLLLGDVAWQRRNIDAVRERPLFMTLMIGEDRAAVLRQFQALKKLERDTPELRLVPGHDGDVVRRLTAEGLVTPGFVLE